MVRQTCLPQFDPDVACRSAFDISHIEIC